MLRLALIICALLLLVCANTVLANRLVVHTVPTRNLGAPLSQRSMPQVVRIQSTPATVPKTSATVTTPKTAVPVISDETMPPQLITEETATGGTLAPDANRLIRWQGWLDIDAFSLSLLTQMQKQLGNDIDIGGIEIGLFTLTEPSILDAVVKARASDPAFVMNANLHPDSVGESITDVTLCVWIYRHNYADAGLYQLYVSANAKVLIGRGLVPVTEPVLSHDIQSLGYEFGHCGGGVMADIFADVEIWRGVVVRVNARGEIVIVGNEAGAEVNGGVARVPMSAWERAPSITPVRASVPVNVIPTFFYGF